MPIRFPKEPLPGLGEKYGPGQLAGGLGEFVSAASPIDGSLDRNLSTVCPDRVDSKKIEGNFSYLPNPSVSFFEKPAFRQAGTAESRICSAFP